MTSWRDLPADGRDLDALVAERVLGIHVHVYERVSANTYICSREGCDWRGSGGAAEGPRGYSTNPGATADVLRWFEEQGWSWEASYRWGLGYRASITMQQESPFTYTGVEDCPSWPVAICRVALDMVEGVGG